ncbi:MAG TPA: SatD family protein [Flavobacteriaceae bacterium]|nr:SatD family protein [Flavobacteriaceae bacterium]
MRAAVLTCDLINSSKLKKKELQLVQDYLQEEFRKIQKRFKKRVAHFEMYRGDGFQGIVLDPEDALTVAFWLKSSVKKFFFQNGKISKASKSIVDFRMAIGIGEIDGIPKSLKQANGEAFIFSGRTLDAMKGRNQKTSLKTNNEYIDDEFNVHFKFFDLLTDKWSLASAEVVYFLLHDLKETEIAQKLGISQSAVNSRKKASGWEAIAKLLVRFKEVMSQTENQ